MSSLIEQAAERLEQLRLAGVAPHSPDRQPSGSAGAAQPVPPEFVAKEPLAEPQQDPPARPQSPRVEFDLTALAAANLIAPTAPRSQVADEFRVVKRPLINNVKATSAVAGEGKSFTAINLAMSIAAELDHTVMLVDADLARPSLPGMLGVEGGPGLLDVLDGTAKMSEVLLRTKIVRPT